MTSDAALDALLAHCRETAALGQIAQLLSWDQEAAMPPKGTAQRAEQAGALAAVIHARHADPRIADWCAAVDEGTLDAAGRANLREARRRHEHATLIPPALAAELARVTALGHAEWAAARAASDFAAFRPTLARIVELTRQHASCLARGGDPYDALLDLYEPGATADWLAGVFAALRPGLVELAQRIAERPAPPAIRGNFGAEGQLRVARRVATAMGYDMEAGRLDTVLHPFCSGTRGDVRITTRIDPADPLGCLYSTIHETGHALYEQGLPEGLAFQPAGNSVSMGIHESQSRLCENQIARSAPFAEWLWPLLAEELGETGLTGPRDLWRAVNRVGPGYIRTEADEVHYNLHILLRFDLERALIGGTLEVADLEEAWNERFEADFGRKVPDAANGVLQDVHWSGGLFGYFPTYTLGNVYAAGFWAKLRADLPEADDLIRAGAFGPIRDWLGRKVHARASLDLPGTLVESITGAPADAGPLLAYLDAKYAELYDL